MILLPLLASVVIGQAEVPEVPDVPSGDGQFSLRVELGATFYDDFDTGSYFSIGGVYAMPLNDTLNLTFGADLGSFFGWPLLLLRGPRIMFMKRPSIVGGFSTVEMSAISSRTR